MMAGRFADIAAGWGDPSPPARSPARDEAIRRMLPVAGTRGWSVDVLRDVAGPDADLLFPGGEAELAEACFDLADREMENYAHTVREPKLGRRVRALILMRLDQAGAHRAAIGRALSVLLLPGNARSLARVVARSVNAIWLAASDHSGGLTWYTKRLTLTSIYVPVLLFWLARGDDRAAVAAFVDRALAGVVSLGRLRARLTGRGVGVRASAQGG